MSERIETNLVGCRIRGIDPGVEHFRNEWNEDTRGEIVAAYLNGEGEPELQIRMDEGLMAGTIKRTWPSHCGMMWVIERPAVDATIAAVAAPIFAALLLTEDTDDAIDDALRLARALTERAQ